MGTDLPPRFEREIHLGPGEKVNGRFVVQSPIGEGSIGQTYRAADEMTGRDVALKMIPAREIVDWKEVELFQREIRVLRGLGHPRIPDYLDVFQAQCGGTPAVGIAQEFIEEIGRAHV